MPPLALRSITSATLLLVSIRSCALRLIEPSTRPTTNMPTLHASSPPRWSRNARASAVRRCGVAAGRPGRSGSRPAPTSRRARSANASAAQAPAISTHTSSGHQRSPANGRISCAMPMGESQVSALPWTSPTARRANAAPRTTPASPLAARALVVTCAVTAPTPANIRPQAPSEAPSATEPAAGSPSAISPRAAIAAIATSAPATTSSAAATGAFAPTAPARISSVRPVSSSARVWRVTIMKLISATITARLPVRHEVRPPIVSSARGGPYRIVKVVLPSTVAAKCSRSWSVGYRPWKLDAVITTKPARMAIHTGSRIRSRRSMNRARVSVPVTLRPRSGAGRAPRASAGGSRGCARRAGRPPSAPRRASRCRR